MNTYKEVQQLIDDEKARGFSKPVIVTDAAYACIGWPYVFGAWGERCVPSQRGRRMSSDHPTIKSKCHVLSDSSIDWRNLNDNSRCSGCKWCCGVRMFDCRGFTYWLLRQVDITLVGQGATSQYNTDSNWVQKGDIAEMPNVVCCVFQKSGNTMQHTGMHIGNGVIIHCSVNVQEGNTSQRAWTHYAIPVGLHNEIPKVVHPTVRKGSTGEAVKELQKLLNQRGYNCGTADGIFGAKTEAAVKAFQKANGLSVDGICGKKTWAALIEEPQSLYDIKIHNATYDQASKIKQICPDAEIVQVSIS